MSRESLTARRVHLAKPPKAGRLEIFDTVRTGLCFRVTDKGARSWSLLYRFGGKLRRHTIGSYPTIGLAAARQKARDALELVGHGTDPRTVKATTDAAAARQQAETVAAIADKFVTLYAAERRWGDLGRILRREIVEAWGDRPIAEIAHKDALELLATIKERAPVRANRVLAVMKLFFGWAVEQEYLRGSPVATIKKPTRERARDRVLTETEIRAFWFATEAIGWPHGPLCRLLLLTAARRDEIGRLRWAEVDEKRRLIEVSGARTKGGRPHAIPLARAAGAIMAGLPRHDGGAYVFTRRGAVPVADYSNAKHDLDRIMLAELRRLATTSGADPERVEFERWTLHDLRRTARSEMSRIGISPDVAERVLGHAIVGIRATYDRYGFLDEKRHALERWAAHLDSIINPPAGPKVVRLRRKQSASGGTGH